MKENIFLWRIMLLLFPAEAYKGMEIYMEIIGQCNYITVSEPELFAAVVLYLSGWGCSSSEFCALPRNIYTAFPLCRIFGTQLEQVISYGCDRYDSCNGMDASGISGLDRGVQRLFSDICVRTYNISWRASSCPVLSKNPSTASAESPHPTCCLCWAFSSGRNFILTVIWS